LTCRRRLVSLWPRPAAEDGKTGEEKTSESPRDGRGGPSEAPGSAEVSMLQPPAPFPSCCTLDAASAPRCLYRKPTTVASSGRNMPPGGPRDGCSPIDGPVKCLGDLLVPARHGHWRSVVQTGTDVVPDYSQYPPMARVLSSRTPQSRFLRR
jgi:hypothetical protein